jgi:hypothetical protein
MSTVPRLPQYGFSFGDYIVDKHALSAIAPSRRSAPRARKEGAYERVDEIFRIYCRRPAANGAADSDQRDFLGVLGVAECPITEEIDRSL